MAPKKAQPTSKFSNAAKEPKNSSILDYVTIFFVFFGLAISFYAIVVEYKAGLDSEYVALCDISSHISCTKVLTSEYGKIFSYLGLIPKDSPLNQPNTVYGILFYIAFGVVYRYFRSFEWGKIVLLALTTLSMTLCAYLAYILTVKLEDVCIVCYLTYVCNIVLFYSAIVNA